MKVSVRWIKEMAFEAKNDKGLSYFIDAVDEEGNPGIGPTPMEMVLSALAGCTGMDVTSLLRRMDVSFKAFNLQVDATRRKEHPKVFSEIILSYHFDGVRDPEKAIKAVRLSQERYCSVGAMLRKTAQLTYRILIDGKEIFTSAAT